MDKQIASAVERELRLYRERLINRQPLLDAEDDIRNAWRDGSIVITEGKAHSTSSHIENKAIKLAMMSKEREEADKSVAIISNMLHIITERQYEVVKYRYFAQLPVSICCEKMNLSESQYNDDKNAMLERFARAFGWEA